jgi:hypothetical protein
MLKHEGHKAHEERRGWKRRCRFAAERKIERNSIFACLIPILYSRIFFSHTLCPSCLIAEYSGGRAAGLEHLQRMKQFKEVTLFYTHVTAAGVKKLQETLPNCTIEVDP